MMYAELVDLQLRQSETDYTSVEEFLRSLEKRVMGHPVLRHPLVLKFERGELSWQQVRQFGLYYYPHILRTRLYQAAALSVTLDERLQGALASILADEYACEDGRTVVERTHPAIYRKFLRALDFDEVDWEHAPILPAMSEYFETHYQLCRHDPMVAVGTAGIAMEWPIPPLYRSFVAGFRRFPQLDDNAIELFVGHMEIDIEHSELIRCAVAPHCGSADNRRKLERGVFSSLDARYEQLSGLERALERVR